MVDLKLICRQRQLGEVEDFNYLYGMKKCIKCHETKELTEFNKNKRNTNGIDCYCKPCKYQKTREWINNNKHHHMNLNLKWKYKIAGVYGLFENGICLYIGESKRVLDRFTNHSNGIKNLKGRHKKLYENLSQHQHIVFGVLEETPNHKEREQYYINKLKPKYNA